VKILKNVPIIKNVTEQICAQIGTQLQKLSK